MKSRANSKKKKRQSKGTLNSGYDYNTLDAQGVP